MYIDISRSLDIESGAGGPLERYERFIASSSNTTPGFVREGFTLGLFFFARDNAHGESNFCAARTGNDYC